MEAAAVASAVDFHALSRRELQALCKRNGVRANMTNAAMADALQGLASVDGIDEIGATLCHPTPGRSAMKSAAKAAMVAGEEQQQGSPLPRGRRVSMMSPAAIQMDVMEGDDDLKQDLIKEIVKTPGVALRSTRRARATPAPVPTPATLRRSTRTAARKTAAPVEAENLVEEVSTVKRTTRKASARKKMMVDLDQEAEEAAATPKVQEEEPKDVASDLKFDNPEEVEEVTKLSEGDNKKEELEEGEEGSVLENKTISAVSSTPVEPMENSPILGVVSKAESKESMVEETQGAEWSPVDETNNESILAVGDEVNKEDSVNVTGEGLGLAEDILPSAETTVEKEVVAEDTKTTVEDKAVAVVGEEVVGDEVVMEDRFTVTGEGICLAEDKLSAENTEEKEVVAEVAKEKDGTIEEGEIDEDEECSSEDDETSEEIDSTDGNDEENDDTNEKGGCTEMMTEATKDETTEEDEVDEDEEWSSEDDESSEETDSTDDNDEENDDTNEEVGGCTEVMTNFNEDELVQVMQDTVVIQVATENSVEEASKGGSAKKASEDHPYHPDEEDDFTSDLAPEFHDIVVHGATDETKTDSTTKDVSDEANTVDTIVKSLDEFTIKEATNHPAEENIGAEVVGSKEVDLSLLSRRKLESMVRDKLAAKEGKKQHSEAKRVPLEEVGGNTDC